MSPTAKWCWGIGGSVISGLLIAGTIWFVPYQIKHHVETNGAVIQIAQMSSEWNEFIMRRDLDELLTAKSRRPLSEYEEKRLRHLQRKFKQLLNTKYKNGKEI